MEKSHVVETEKRTEVKSKSDDKENEKKSNDKDGSGPPKAMVMVKPQVLTHVIEGFVIQESSEPFPVNRGCMDGLIRKMPSSEALENGEPPKKKLSTDKEDKKEREMATCETCGKTDLRSKFKKSKRFCSMSCVKSSRVGLFCKVEEKANSEGEPEAIESVEEASPSPEVEEPEVGRNFSNPSPEDNTNRVNPLQWTVAEVCEFIRTLPGCADYVEDFAMQDIDGEALMLLKPDHLMSVMSMKLGPAVKIIAKIDTMRTDSNPAT